MGSNLETADTRACEILRPPHLKSLLLQNAPATVNPRCLRTLRELFPEQFCAKLDVS